MESDMTNTNHEAHDGHHHKDANIFFFSTHRLTAPHERIKVSALKEFISAHVQGFNASNTLVLEERGDRPDRPLGDNDDVHICEIPHFYDQPPANFG
jgi:hypothetical protein